MEYGGGEEGAVEGGVGAEEEVGGGVWGGEYDGGSRRPWGRRGDGSEEIWQKGQ